MQLVSQNYYPQRDSEGATNHLMNESVKRWNSEQGMVDDITILVVFLTVGDSEKPSSHP